MTKKLQIETLEKMKLVELKQIAKNKKIPNWWKLKKHELIEILKNEIEKNYHDDEKNVNHELIETLNQMNNDEYIHLKEICYLLETDTKGARRILRDNNIDKKFKQWKWLKNDVKIKNIIFLLLEHKNKK